jgi:hypothetical protein
MEISSLPSSSSSDDGLEGLDLGTEFTSEMPN